MRHETDEVGGTNDDAAPWQGACASVRDTPDGELPHESWDLDIGDGQSWIRAIRICAEECPARASCIAARTEFFPHSNPQGVIWAGVAYSETGRVLDAEGLRRLTAVQRNKPFRGRPSRPAAVSAHVA